jgi:hypothetical protein
MSYLDDIGVEFTDSANIDAFGRLRVSQVTTQLDIKQLHDQAPLFIDEVTSGTGNASHSTTNAMTTLTTSALNDYVVLQTFQRMNYQSGKSLLIFWTFNNMGPELNVTKSVGYFSTSTVAPYTADRDGIRLHSDGSDMRLQIYRTGTNTLNVAQADWDDPLDGTGPSGVTHDFDDNTIMAVDFEWLGVGRVRFYIVKDGGFIKIHEADFVGNGNSMVYMSSPNQPMRWELRQSGFGSGTLNAICSSVNSEGSINQLGKVLSENLGVATVNANTVGTKYALMGITLQSSKVDSLIDLLDTSTLTTTADNILLELWLNPTVAGTFTYNNVSNSSVAIAKGDTVGNPSTTTVTGGTRLFSQYVAQKSATPLQIENAIRLGISIAGNTDKIVLTATPLTSNCDVTASLSWRELI